MLFIIPIPLFFSIYTAIPFLLGALSLFIFRENFIVTAAVIVVSDIVTRIVVLANRMNEHGLNLNMLSSGQTLKLLLNMMFHYGSGPHFMFIPCWIPGLFFPAIMRG